MTEEDRLRVQNSVSLSIALISFSAALIAGAVAGFFAIADKINKDAFLVAFIVSAAIVLLTLSIMFGGMGISATNKSIKETQGALAANYDKGKFSWQVMLGGLGLLLGAIGFICLATVTLAGKQERVEMSEQARQIRDIRSAIENVDRILQGVAQSLSEMTGREKVVSELLAKNIIRGPSNKTPANAPNSQQGQ